VLLDVSINNTSRISVSVLLERMNQFDSGNGAIPCEVKLARLPV
jgi:hypothetical protein